MEDRTVLGPMPDLVAKLLIGREAYIPYLDACAEYPDESEVARTFSAGGEQIVVARPEALAEGPLEVALAYLAHEAVHCTFRHMEQIGEETPGEEEMAYHVACAAHGLFADFFKWLGAE